MSVQPTRDSGSVPYQGYGEENRGYAWIVLAGAMLLLVGTSNVTEGAAAIGNARFLVHDTHYIFGSLKTGDGSRSASAWSSS